MPEIPKFAQNSWQTETESERDDFKEGKGFVEGGFDADVYGVASDKEQSLRVIHNDQLGGDGGKSVVTNWNSIASFFRQA